MPLTYTVLLRLALRHDYFADGVLRTLALHPTPASAERLRRAGWLLKAQPDGLLLLAPTPAGRAEAEAGAGASMWPAGVPSPLPLVFCLQPLEASFADYTDLPSAPDAAARGSRLAGRQLAHYFSLPAPAEQPGQPRASVAQPLALRPLRFDYTGPADRATGLWAVPGDAAALRHYPARVRHPPAVLPVKLPVHLAVKELSRQRVRWPVNVPGSGQHELRSFGGTPFCFYADDYLAETRPWGLLELTEQVLTAAAGTCYTLRFAARRAYWQYRVLGPLPPAPAMLAIAGDTTGLDFEALPPPAGSSACFRARKQVQLAQHYTLPPLQLAVRQPGPDGQEQLRPLPLRLPVGELSGLKKIKDEKTTCYVTEMMVSLPA